MTATYFGCPVVGVLDYTATTAAIFVEIPECPGPERITDVPLRDIDVWPNLTDHSAPTSCRCGERASSSHSGAQPDPGGEAGSGPNFKEAQ